MTNQVESIAKLEIPPSQHLVDVSVIDTTTFVRCPLNFFVKDPLLGHENLECPSFAFLIEHPSGKKALFDLGLRTDLGSFPPIVKEGIATHTLVMESKKGVAQILQEDGRVTLADIDSIIWSHWHTDHTGDPSTFPSSVELVVGPGFKETFLPGYPADPQGLILESDYVGRQLREIDFTDGIKVAELRAADFFGDGSFYLLDSPGHATGHITALARTTLSTFIFMGGDSCHHCGSLRPSKYLRLPDQVSPSPFSDPPHLQGTICPGALLEAIHPKHSCTEPYYGHLEQAQGRDVALAEATIQKTIAFDASEDVFVILSHDKSLLDVIDFFPKKVNQWKEKGWKDSSRWRFLEDFKDAAADGYQVDDK